MNTNQIGNFGELKVIEKCLQNNIPVFTPFGDGNVVDLILIVNNQCVKAQIKSSTTNEDGKLTFKTCSTMSKRVGDTVHQYTKNDIDIFFFYSYAYDEVYCMRVEDAPKGDVYLRHEEPKHFTCKVRYTKDYPFEKIFEYFPGSIV